MDKDTRFIGVGVVAAIFDKEGRLFLTLRGNNAKNDRGRWQIPGGSVEFGETIEQALKREIKEELDIEIEIVELLGIGEHIIQDQHQHRVVPAYICRIKHGEPTILEPQKCAGVGWFSFEETEKLPLSTITKTDISALKNKYPQGIRL